jgi:hypothetical protein
VPTPRKVFDTHLLAFEVGNSWILVAAHFLSVPTLWNGLCALGFTEGVTWVFVTLHLLQVTTSWKCSHDNLSALARLVALQGASMPIRAFPVTFFLALIMFVICSVAVLSADVSTVEAKLTWKQASAKPLKVISGLRFKAILRMFAAVDSEALTYMALSFHV